MELHTLMFLSWCLNISLGCMLNFDFPHGHTMSNLRVFSSVCINADSGWFSDRHFVVRIISVLLGFYVYLSYFY